MLRQALLLNAADRDGSAIKPSERIERIVRRHTDDVWRTARDLGVARADLEDVTQEVLVVVLRRLDDIEPEKERAFALATTVRVVANWRRGRRRRPEDLSGHMDAVEPLPGLARPRTPEEALERTEKLAVLRAALEQMPEPQRVAFTLFELEQLTAKEIAEQLGVAEATIFSRVHRARAVFRRVCEARESAPASLPRNLESEEARDD